MTCFRISSQPTETQQGSQPLSIISVIYFADSADDYVIYGIQLSPSCALSSEYPHTIGIYMLALSPSISDSEFYLNCLYLNVN